MTNWMNRKIRLDGFRIFLLALLIIPPSVAVGVWLGTPQEIRDEKNRQQRIAKAYQNEIQRLRLKYPETAAEYDRKFRSGKSVKTHLMP